METTTKSGPVKIGEVLEAMDDYKRNINKFLYQRRFFVDHVKKLLVEGRDYYIVNDKKVLGKAGAEKICAAFSLRAEFSRDYDSLKSFPDAKGLVIFKCVLIQSDGTIAGEGRGASTLDKCDNDVNKCLKMSEKSSYICATLRSTFLSADFTQDLEADDLGNPVQTEEAEREKNEPMATDRQKSYLSQLIYDNVGEDQREQALSSLETATRREASEMISSFVGLR